MRDEPIVLVLDEPTAALDAETEHALFERYAAALRGDGTDGRITILVSHRFSTRSEEHTSELQSLRHLVCRLLLEKKKNKINRKGCVEEKHQHLDINNQRIIINDMMQELNDVDRQHRSSGTPIAQVILKRRRVNNR